MTDLDLDNIAFLPNGFVTTSFDVARALWRGHDSVLHAVDLLVAPDSGLTPDFARENFREMACVGKDADSARAYLLSRGGVLMTVSSFSGRRAARAVERFITRWRELDELTGGWAGREMDALIGGMAPPNP